MAVQGRMNKELKAFFWALPAGILMAGTVFFVPQNWFLPVASLPMMPDAIADNILLLASMLSYLAGVLAFIGIFCARIFAVQGDEMARFCASHPAYREETGDDMPVVDVPVITRSDVAPRRPVIASADFANIEMGAANDAGFEQDASAPVDYGREGDETGDIEAVVTVEYEDAPSTCYFVEDIGEEAGGDILSADDGACEPEILASTHESALPPGKLDELIAQMEASVEQRREQLAALETVAAKIASEKEGGAEIQSPDAMSYRPLSAVPREEAVSPDEDMDLALDSALEILQKINRRA